MNNVAIGITAILVAGLALNSAVSWQQLPQQQPAQRVQRDNSEFMRAKMRFTHNILEGLALENFPAISKNAQDLMLMSYESTWSVFQSPDYVTMSRDFRESADRLRNAAKEKNLDGSTLAYFEVTLNCVRCHKLVRQKRQVDAPDEKQKK